MSSKNAILTALKSNSLPAHDMPAINIAPNNDDLLGQFETLLGKIAATLNKDGGIEALQQAIDKLVADGKQVITEIEGVTANREVPADPHDLKDIDYAVVKGRIAVAENGSIWVSSQDLTHRITPFICENLFLVIEQDSIVPNMHEAVKKIELEGGNLGVFIAGPSKTADIEQALVVGAHGACSLSVFMI